MTVGQPQSYVQYGRKISCLIQSLFLVKKTISNKTHIEKTIGRVCLMLNNIQDCHTANYCVNNRSYADDTVLLAPTLSALQ